MKYQLTHIYAIIVALCLMMASCSDSYNAGTSVLQDDEMVVVGCDTFKLTSDILAAKYLVSAPDSLLLGECDNMFGTIDADIITQLACPEGFSYPQNAVFDSAVLYMYYRSYFGDGMAPLGIKVYQLDKATFDYQQSYGSNIDINDYCSLNDSTVAVEHEHIITAADYLDSLELSSTTSTTTTTVTPCVKIKLNDTFLKRFTSKRSYSTQEDFNQFFKGLFISNSFGSSTILYISSINMGVYYHFSYPKNGKDTTVNDMKAYYANSEVRQINRVTYPRSNITQLSTLKDSVNFISSPANVYTKIDIPIMGMSDSIISLVGRRRPYINQAQLKVDVLNNVIDYEYIRDAWALPADNMLLIKQSALEQFFKDKELPSDTCAILSSLLYDTDSLGVSHYYYSYDLSALLTNQLRQSTKDTTLTMLLVPVVTETTTSQTSSYSSSTTTTLVGIHQQQTISATIIRSAQSKANPMNIEVVYSGF